MRRRRRGSMFGTVNRLRRKLAARHDRWAPGAELLAKQPGRYACLRRTAHSASDDTAKPTLNLGHGGGHAAFPRFANDRFTPPDIVHNSSDRFGRRVSRQQTLKLWMSANVGRDERALRDDSLAARLHQPQSTVDEGRPDAPAAQLGRHQRVGEPQDFAIAPIVDESLPARSVELEPFSGAVVGDSMRHGPGSIPGSPTLA